MAIGRHIKLVLLIAITSLHFTTNALGSLTEKHTFNEQLTPGTSRTYYIYETGTDFNFTATQNITVHTIQVNSYLAGISDGSNAIVKVKINGNVFASWNLTLTREAKEIYNEKIVNCNLYAGDTITYFVYTPGFSGGVPGAQLIDGNNYVSLNGESGPERPKLNLQPVYSLLLPSNDEFHVLSLNKAGDGTGSVTDGTGLVNCPTSCTQSWSTFSAGTSVTLTATASSDSTFTGWSGGGCSGTGTCIVTMDQALSVTATFTENSISTSLGLLCSNDCAGSWCMSSGSSTCVDSNLSMPCLGTATGMYCSQSCQSDIDCVNPNTEMKCLVSCPNSSMAAGKCWTTSDYAFMTEFICQ